MKHPKDMDLTVGDPFGSLLKFALPVILGNLFQLFYTLADSVIVGKTLGFDALAAVGSTSVIIYFILCFIGGFTGGFGICLGQRCGAKDEWGMRKSAAVSTLLSAAFAALLTALCCFFSHNIIDLMKIPADISADAYSYMFVVLAGTGATVFYNMISNMLRALGDSRTPLYCLIFSSALNIFLDILFILSFKMGVAGAAWATVLSQLLSALCSLAVGLKKFPVLRLRHEDFHELDGVVSSHLRIGFPMGFQMSVMCIGQLSMQAAVNALGPQAIAGYTAATKVDQVSVLVNGAFGIAMANYAAQNYGARLYGRIRSGLYACLFQTECANLLMCAGLLLCRKAVVGLFITDPTPEVIGYAERYLLVVSPFYLLLGLLQIYRSAEQSIGDSRTPFIACLIELFMRILGTSGLAHLLGYTGICLAHPLAWLGATSLLIPVYYARLRHLELSFVPVQA